MRGQAKDFSGLATSSDLMLVCKKPWQKTEQGAMKSLFGLLCPDAHCVLSSCESQIHHVSTLLSFAFCDSTLACQMLLQLNVIFSFRFQELGNRSPQEGVTNVMY